MATPAKEPTVLHLYRTDHLPGYWIASTIGEVWYRFPDEPNGWAERSPFADFRYSLEEITDRATVREIAKRCGITHVRGSGGQMVG